MPNLEVSVLLPYYLRVNDGNYQIGQGGETVQVATPPLLDGIRPRTRMSARFLHEQTTDLDQIQRQRARDTERLLHNINKLLRWYRTVTRRSEITELTRAQASPFTFTLIEGEAGPEWISPFNVEATGPPRPVEISTAEISQAVIHGLTGGNDPDVAELFLLDAERALYEGRFREAVLFAWSTIDSEFNQKYDALIDVVLAGEWKGAREFFTGVDFGLKNKMTGALYLACHRSLFREPGDFWENLVASYNKRNDIIHRGQNANENEARQAIDVAQHLVEVMNVIGIPTTG